jgi:hypothetical protein
MRSAIQGHSFFHPLAFATLVTVTVALATFHLFEKPAQDWIRPLKATAPSVTIPFRSSETF